MSYCGPFLLHIAPEMFSEVSETKIFPDIPNKILQCLQKYNY